MYESIQPVFTELIWVLAGGALGFLGLFAGLFRHARAQLAWRWIPVGPALLVISVGLAAVAGLWNPDRGTGVVAAALIRPVGLLGLLPMTSLGLLTLSGLAWARGEKSVRNLAIGASMWALVAVLIGAQVRFAVAPLVPLVTLGVWCGFGVLASPALAAGGRSATAASLLLCLWGGLAEGAARSLVPFFAFVRSTAMPEVPLRGEAVRRMFELVAGGEPSSAAVLVGLGMLPAAVALATPWTERKAVDLLPLSLVLLVPLAAWWGVPDEQAVIAASTAFGGTP